VKKLFLLLLILVSLVLGLCACGGSNDAGSPSAPVIARVRLWITLSGNPDDPPETTLTPEQTLQANIWARGTTEEKITFKVNLTHGEEFNTLVTNVHTEGTGKAVGVGGLANPLEPGDYKFQAVSGAFGEIIGSLEITVASAIQPAQPSTPPELSPLPSPLPVTVSATPSEQPDIATLRKYFKELGLGKLPAEVKDLPTELQKNAGVFTAGDQICLYGDIILECQLRNTVYDVIAGKVINEGGLPRPMTGGFAGWEPLTIPVGKYEYRVYVDDILVGVFPFEVR
jgi:hypothetical protein